jgi:hypothetical protein
MLSHGRKPYIRHEVVCSEHSPTAMKRIHNGSGSLSPLSHHEAGPEFNLNAVHVRFTLNNLEVGEDFSSCTSGNKQRIFTTPTPQGFKRKYLWLT